MSAGPSSGPYCPRCPQRVSYLFMVVPDPPLKKPSSVYELSRILNRDLKNVLQDVAYLADLGIVKVEETKDKKVPSVAYDRIAFEVAI